VIAVSGDTVACLGGWRGDGLFVSRGGSALARVAELGWDAATQTTPQRRLLLREADVLVLEPVHGFLLLPPLRARRFDFEGRELGSEEGGDRGPAMLAYHARAAAGGRSRVTRCGIDPATARPTVEEEDLAADLPCGRPECSGTPALAAGAVHYPVRMRGLFRGPERLFEGDPGIPQTLGDLAPAVGDGGLVCAGNRDGEPGLWAGGAWHRLPGARLFPAWRAPLGPLVVRSGEGCLVLRREGGDLPSLRASPARVPPGIYSALVTIAGVPYAVAESAAGPTLVPVSG
jgi:hypothetical protein